MRYTYPGLIDFELNKEDEECLFFEIFSQDASIYNKVNSAQNAFYFQGKSSYGIRSYDYLDVMEDCTYLLGYQSEKATSQSTNFSSTEERDRVHDLLLEALGELAESRGIKLLGSEYEPEQLTLWD